MIISYSYNRNNRRSAIRLSTRTRYGIRALLELAASGSDGPLHVNTIAQRQGISVKYLEQLMAMLKTAGFVRSVRGAGGGYILAKAADQIKLSDCFKTLEGPVATVECVKNNSYCQRTADCVVRNIWVRVQKAIDAVLESVTLQDLVDKTQISGMSNYQI